MWQESSARTQTMNIWRAVTLECQPDEFCIQFSQKNQQTKCDWSFYPRTLSPFQEKKRFVHFLFYFARKNKGRGKERKLFSPARNFLTLDTLPIPFLETLSSPKEEKKDSFHRNKNESPFFFRQSFTVNYSGPKTDQKSKWENETEKKPLTIPAIAMERRVEVFFLLLEGQSLFSVLLLIMISSGFPSRRLVRRGNYFLPILHPSRRAKQFSVCTLRCRRDNTL